MTRPTLEPNRSRPVRDFFRAACAARLTAEIRQERQAQAERRKIHENPPERKPSARERSRRDYDDYLEECDSEGRTSAYKTLDEWIEAI